jgi:hypothetical protein
MNLILNFGSLNLSAQILVVMIFTAIPLGIWYCVALLRSKNITRPIEENTSSWLDRNILR